MRILISPLIAAAVLFCFSAPGYSGSFTIHVNGKKQDPVSEVLVSVHGEHLPKASPMRVELLQDERRFSSSVMVVTQGSEINFINNDDINHQVYSFSKPWRQQFKLKSGENRNYQFNQPGTVVLGCNTHDWMLSYIYVLDTENFGFTDAAGRYTTASLPPGEYVLRVQHPRIKDGGGVVEQVVSLEEGENRFVDVSLKKSLLAMRDQEPDFELY